ncbi:MAG: hypothetical protein GF411_14450 [Candidatus Lokiarchaeota archaeon]|nr:hypothetical protein [Candidatus Lokiarchaeota archaeon]
MQVMIGVPNMGMISSGLASWLMTHERFGHDTKIIPMQSSIFRPLTKNRNYIRDVFLDSGFDFCLQLDNDIIPCDNLINMVDNDVDICSAHLRTVKNSQLMTLCMHERDDGYIPQNVGNGLVECDAIGGGCMLIKREVLEKVEFPYITNECASEDFGFCKRAKESGFKVYMDFRFKCSHYTMCYL